MGAPAALVLFLIMLGVLYWLTNREYSEYEEIDQVMESGDSDQTAQTIQLSDDDQDDTHVNVIWNGDLNGREVKIIRGENYRDSNRSITILIPSELGVRFQLDRANPLRRVSRWVEELFSSRSRISFDGPLDNLIGYGTDPHTIQEFLRPWDQPNAVEELTQFHDIRATSSGLKARFYQHEINQEEIQQKTHTFSNLATKLELPPAPVEE